MQHSHAGGKPSALFWCQSNVKSPFLLPEWGLRLSLSADNKKQPSHHECRVAHVILKHKTSFILTTTGGSTLHVFFFRFHEYVKQTITGDQQGEGAEAGTLPGLWGEEVERPGVSLSTPLWLLLLQPAKQSSNAALQGVWGTQSIHYSYVRCFLTHFMSRDRSHGLKGLFLQHCLIHAARIALRRKGPNSNK